MSRGGARHFAKPDVDPGVLLRTLRDHAETIKDLGTYETISKAGAVNLKGLLYCKSLLQDIIEIAPTCQIGPQALRTSLTQLLTHNVTLNTSKFNGATWANIKSERLTVLLAHCRKMARDKEQQRVCAGKLTTQEFQQLQLLIAEVVLKDEDGPLQKGKALKRKVSDASLDSEGFPAMLQTPKDKNPCKKGKSPRRNGNNSPSTKNSSPKKNNTRALVKREDKALNISGEGLVQKLDKLQGAGAQLTNLRLSMFTSETSPHQSYAFLDAKGGECKWLAPALLEVMRNLLKPDRAIHATMVACLEAMVQLVSLWDGAGIFLTETGYDLTMSLCNAFCQEYTHLHKWAQDEDRMLFNVVRKHHTFIHLCLEAKFLNPRYHWCFKSEDFVGAMAKLGHSSSHGVASQKLSTKVLPKYAILLHLLLTREGFSFDG
eukprot:Skav217399  [mRNA]  locus=scaffold532:724880:732954:+ [translate_table: standard]